MFAKLKKKIEDEVGDLGQLTSPLANPFGGAADRRVGGSSQGSNTPNNLGSRQSSVASLVDLHPIDEHPPSNSTSNNASSSRTSNSAVAARQKQQEILDVELKKVNADWIKKIEAMKKSYEERIQNQEADFAWKYSSKDDELERVRMEKRKLEETVKNMEGTYQNKMTRVQDDMDQLEGFTKQEMAKVKHLLLNTQADLQKVKCDLVESESKVKEISEENRNLKAEYESMHRNFDRDRLQRVKFDSDHGDSKSQISDLQKSKQQLENEIRTLKEDILSKNKRIDEYETNAQRSISEKQGEIDAFERRYSVIESDLKTEKASVSNLSHQVSELQNSKVQLENSVKVLQEEILSKNIVATHLQEQVSASNSEREKDVAKLQNSNLGLEKQVQLLKNNLKSKETELHDLQLLQQNVQKSGAEASEEMSKLLRSNEDLQGQIKILSEDLTSKQRVIDEHSAKKDEILKINDKLEGEFKILIEQKDTLTKQLEEVVLQNNESQAMVLVLQKQVSDLNATASKASADQTDLIAEIDELRNSKKERDALTKKMDDVVLQKSELKNEVVALQKQVTELNACALNARNDLTNSISEIEALRNSKLELQNRVERLDNEMSLKQVLIEELRQSSSDDRSDSVINDLQRQITDLTAEVDRTSSTESKLEAQITTLKASNVNLDNQIRTLNTEHDQKLTGLQDASRAAEEKMVNTFHKRISELEMQLEKQTNLAEQHNELQVQISELKNSKLLLGNEVLKLKDGIILKGEQCAEFQGNNDRLVQKVAQLESELTKKSSELAELDDSRNSNMRLEKQLQQLSEDLKSKENKLAEFQEESLQSEKRTEQLHETLTELEAKLSESSKHSTEVQTQLERTKSLKNQLDEEMSKLRYESEQKDQLLSKIQHKVENNSQRESELEREIQSFETIKNQLENELKVLSEKQSQSYNASVEFQQKISDLETQLRNSDLEAAEHNDVLVQVSELQSTKDELEEELKFVKEQVEARDLKIAVLEEKIAVTGVNNANSGVPPAIVVQQDESEDVESLRERIRELESQLGDKNKALKLRQQQLQDLRKSLAKEIRNTPGDSISKSGSQTSLRELETPIRSEEQSQVETEPAVIQTSNSHSSEASNCLAAMEDVNFQYMKSVIFKYVTSSDPQMTHHLTKVVSTLLHLNDEEQRLLQKSTDRRLVSWLGTRDHVL